jgi:hypothetical protein
MTVTPPARIRLTIRQRARALSRWPHCLPELAVMCVTPIPNSYRATLGVSAARGRQRRDREAVFP